VLLQDHSGIRDITTSHAIREKAFDNDKPLTHLASDTVIAADTNTAAAAVPDDDDVDDASKQLEVPLSADGSCNIDRVSIENSRSNSDLVAVATAEPVEVSGAAMWCRSTGDGLEVGDIVSDHLELLSTSSQRLTSLDNPCDHQLSVSSIRQLNALPGDDVESVNYRHTIHCEQPVCECYTESHCALVEEQSLELLFSCRQCSVNCSKHFACNSLHIVLHVIRHSDMDSSMFTDASLTIVKSDTYLTKVINVYRVACSIFSVLLAHEAWDVHL